METETSNILAEIERLKELFEVADKGDVNVREKREEIYTSIEKAFDANKINQSQKETLKDQLKAACP